MPLAPAIRNTRVISIRTAGAVMSIDRIVLAFAGSVILLSLSLAVFINQNWLILTAFVGMNQLQAAFTGFCPLALILKKLGVAPGAAFN